MSSPAGFPDSLYLSRLREVLSKKFPYFVGNAERQYSEFGDSWAAFFEEDMGRIFGGDLDRFDLAIEGYG